MINVNPNSQWNNAKMAYDAEVQRLRADLTHARGEIAYLRTQVGLLKLRNKSIVALKEKQ